MNQQDDKKNHNKSVKRSFFGVAAFYVLIAFEFFYMASPFAIYFYSAYSPVLDFFNQNSKLGWLISYFMPHIIVETSSPLINAHNIIGAILAVIGFAGFVIGACQVYYRKLTKKGIVTGGIYNFIRHPQYASFILCSFGLVILWPRYIVLFMFVTMLFAYYILARVEERECEEKFGQSYIEYKNKTGMFFPFKILKSKNISILPKSKPVRVAALFGMYVLTLLITFGIARLVNNYSLDSLYSVYSEDLATISVCELEEDKINEIIQLALNDATVKERIETTKVSGDGKLLNYILPTQWYVAEIPMNGLDENGGHRSPSNYNKSEYKIIITLAEMRSEGNLTGKEIIQNVKSRKTIAEVWVNIEEGKVIKVLDRPDTTPYKDIPVAIY